MVKRNEDGTVKKGSVLNPHGRKPKPAEEKTFELFRAAVSDDDITAIVKKAVALAKMGDAASRKFIFDYLVGPPVEKKEITGADGDAIFVTLLGQDERSQD